MRDFMGSLNSNSGKNFIWFGICLVRYLSEEMHVFQSRHLMLSNHVCPGKTFYKNYLPPAKQAEKLQ